MKSLASSYNYNNNYNVEEEKINKLPNEQGITHQQLYNISCVSRCPIGKELFTAQVTIDFTPNKYLIDVELTKNIIELKFSGMTGMIEDVCNRIFEYLMRYEPSKLTVTASGSWAKVEKCFN